MFRGTSEPGSIDLSRQTRQEAETHIAAGLAHDSHHASGLGRDGLGMLTVVLLPVVTSGTKDDLDASNCDSGHPKRLSFPDGHSMGQQTQTPAEGLRAPLARNATWAILDRVTPLENPRMGGAGGLCLLRIEDRGVPNWRGSWKLPRQNESSPVIRP